MKTDSVTWNDHPLVILNCTTNEEIFIIIYNYGLHEKLISIIIKLRKGYFPEVRRCIIILN